MQWLGHRLRLRRACHLVPLGLPELAPQGEQREGGNSKQGRASAVQVLLSPRRFSIFTKLAHLDIPANINFQTAPWITHPVFILGTV